jgi:hypothetical protein
VELRRKLVSMLALVAVGGASVVSGWNGSPAGAFEVPAASGTGVMSQGAPDPAHPYVDHVTGGTAILWREMEASDQAFTGPAWGRIDALLANPAVRSVRLRIYAGRHAPDFVKALGGPVRSGDGLDCSAGGIAVINAYDDVGGCIPYFWSTPALDQYEQLIREVARRYGSHPKLTEVVDSACMTTYAEPFYRAHAHRASNTRLWQAGLNPFADAACHERAMAIHAGVLPNQRVSLAINPWELIVDPATDPDGKVNNWAATYEFAQRWRARLGSRLVLQNNGWGENEGCPTGGRPDTNVYCYLRTVAAPKGFQSETWARLGDSKGGDSGAGWIAALQRAVDYGACFVESTDNRYREVDPQIAAELDRRLAANCGVTAPLPLPLVKPPLAPAVAPAPTPTAASVPMPMPGATAAVAATSNGSGAWTASTGGGVRSWAAAPFHGGASALGLAAPIVGMARTGSGSGYWLLGRDGGVFSYGDAVFHGSTGNLRLNQPVVGIAADPRRRGYWFVAADGGIFSFGAPFHGSAGAIRLNQPVVGMAATTSGDGYWLVARDGGIFSYGDARFAGSTGAIRLNQPIVGMAADPDGGGYWFVAADGGVFSFDATFHGSGVGMLGAGDRVVGMAPHAGGGYFLATAGGRLLGFGVAAAVTR